MDQILKNKELISNICNEIKKAKTITLLTHSRPDGDGVSACAALEHVLTKLDKKIETIYPDKPEFNFKRISKNLFIDKYKQIPDLIIALDTANYARLYYPEIFKNIPLINIDHHVSNSIKGTYNFIEHETSSACEVLFKLLQDCFPNLIDKYVAECLLFGILYDSQIFHTQSTYPKTLQISAQLMELGANLYELKTELLSNKSPKIIALWGKIMSSMQVTKDKKALWISVWQKDLKEFDLNLSSLIGFNNFLSQMAGIDITLLFYETDNGQTKVSLRSKKTDVNKLAAKFGGGGHKNAAGILSDKPMKELINEITSLL